MKPAICMALIACLAMVSWATWYRLSSAPSLTATLAAVAAPEQSQAYYDELLAKVMDTASSTPAADAEPLTATDLIGRQLVSDYISLAQSGQVTSDTLETLGGKYATSLAQITQAPRITFQDVKTAENSSVSFNAYMQGINDIYRKYMPALSAGSENAVNQQLSKNDYTLFATTARAYAAQASELESLAVPVAFIKPHLELVNNNLLNAAAYKAVSSIDTDPAAALAGIVALNQNTATDSAILKKLLLIAEGKSDGI